MRRARHTRARLLLSVAALILAAIAATASHGAGSSVVVTLDVLSSTTIDASGCQSGTSDVTDFGTMLPATERALGTPCTVAFGSSNASSTLRLYQQDGGGRAMWMPPWGPMDDTFSGDGFHRFVSLSSDQRGWEGLVDQSGRIIVASEGWVAAQSNYSGALTALDAAGTPDPGFGSGGTWVTGLPERDRIYDVVELADGSFIAAGYREVGGAGWQYERSTLWKVTPSGAPDPFYNGGLGYSSITWTGGTHRRDEFWSLSLQDDGKVVAAGHMYPIGVNQYDAAIARFDEDGQLDGTFGGGDGMVTIDVSGTSENDVVRSVELQDDGKIVVGGYTTTGTDDNVFLLRLDPDGTLDNTFGVNGIVELGSGTVTEHLWHVAIDSQQRILWSGNSDDGVTQQSVVGRLLVGGGEDPDFGAAGRVLTTSGTETTWIGILPMADGRIALAGNVEQGGNNVATIGRLHDDGSYDTSLDGDGIRPEPTIGPGENMHYWRVRQGTDGELYGIGAKSAAGAKEVLVSRYRSEPIEDYGTNTWASASTTNLFGACLSGVTNATATWTSTGSCTATDADPWNGIPATSGAAGAPVASAGTGVQNASVDVLFGAATASDQRPGGYMAPVVFEVVAP